MLLCEMIGTPILVLLELLIKLCDIVGDFTFDIAHLSVIYLMIAHTIYESIRHNLIVATWNTHKMNCAFIIKMEAM